MNIIQVKSALCQISLLFITILLVSCGSEKSPQDKNAAAIDFKLKWPVGKSVGSIIPPIPAGVVTVRMSVSGPGVATIARDFDVSLRTGSIPNVPVGINRTITFQGLASNGDLIYQAVVPNVTLVADKVFNSGTVAMSAVEAPPVPTAPMPPSGLSATAISDTQIDLVWVDNSNDETGFRIERKTGSGGSYAPIFPAAPNDIKYSDTSLSAAATYYYRVVATNSTGDSVSNEVSATTAPVAPPVVSTYSISGTITNGLAGVTITRSSNGSTTTTTNSSGNYSFSGTGNGNYTLTPRMTGYTFDPPDQTVIVNGDNLTAMNFSASVVEAAPVAPSGLSATAISSTQINLAWQDNNNETGYKVERSMTGLAGTYVQIATVAADVTVYNDTTGSASTIYYYRILAANGVGDSGYGNVVNATTDANTYKISGSITRAGAAFAGVSVTLAGSGATTTTTDGNGSYSFIEALDGGYTLTPAKPGYVFTPPSQPVTVNGANLTAATFVATADAAPAAPSGLSATAGSASQINLAWVDNSNNETGYTIERKIGAGGTYAVIRTEAADAISSSDPNISSSTSYYYRVWATNETGDSGYSAEAAYTTAAVPTPPTGDVFSDPTTGLQLVKVAGGTFIMGDTFTGVANELPTRLVTLSDFYIGKYEVTQGEWSAVMGTNPSGFACASCPVETVSWNDIQLFITKLNGLSNTTYRLPTEAEWEYAAAVRTDGLKERYSGGSVVGDVAWYPVNATGTTHPVGGKTANNRGIYDMSGNVWEWVNDWYSADYRNATLTNPPGSSYSAAGRVIRGGSWSAFVGTSPVADTERTTCRGALVVAKKYNYLGFRLAASP